jgi:hypothetical protein
MADGFTVDFSDLTRLAADLDEVPDNAGPKIRQAVEVSARNVKDAWRGKLQGARSLPRAAASIDYTVKGSAAASGSVVEAEIGARNGGQGSLVGKTEFGSVNNGPKGYGAGALAETQEDFERGLSRALADAERQAGL